MLPVEASVNCVGWLAQAIALVKFAMGEGAIVIDFVRLLVQPKLVDVKSDTLYVPASGYVKVGLRKVEVPLVASPNAHCQPMMLLSVGMGVVSVNCEAVPAHENGGRPTEKSGWGLV